MAKYSEDLDAVLSALADPTRRSVVARLGRGPASIGELAKPLSISLPSFMKHVRTLESCGLIRTQKSGRVRTCVLNRNRLALVNGWLEEQRQIWEARTDRLERFVTTDSSAPSVTETPSVAASPSATESPSVTAPMEES